MNIDSTVRILDAVTKLMGILVWPAIALFVLIRFGSALREFVANMAEFSLKGAGFEASGKRRQAEAAAALTAAALSRPDLVATPAAAAQGARETADIVAEVVTPRMIRRAGRSVLLWVDDKPGNNVHERQALEALGVNVVISTSTDDAIERIKQQTFDAIISDMGRPPDARAGYTLLDRLRSSGNRTPYVIYASSRSPEDQAEARQRGAIGCTNRPNELFEMVLSILGRWRE